MVSLFYNKRIQYWLNLLETYITGPRIYTKNHIDIPGRTLAVLNVTVDVRKEHWNKDFYVKANRLLN